MVVALPPRLVNVTPVVFETMTPGIVGWFGVPSCAIEIGGPPTLLRTTTPTEPAFCAFRILVENVHVPRGMSAIAPARPLRAEQPLLETTDSGPLTAADGPNWPTAAAKLAPPTVTLIPMKWPTVTAPAVSARAAAPGDSTVLKPG